MLQKKNDALITAPVGHRSIMPHGKSPNKSRRMQKMRSSFSYFSGRQRKEKKVRQEGFAQLCKKTQLSYFLLFSLFFLLSSCVSSAQNPAQSTAPDWLTNIEKAYPSKEWVAVTAQGASQLQAENAAMNALARAFKTDVESITDTSQQFSEIIENVKGSKTVTFNTSKNFSQDVQTANNIKGLIGVQIDMYRAKDNTVYVNARMNRKECSARYTGMINENVAIINRLLSAATVIPEQDTLEVYSRFSFAYAIAQVTDNFQNILEVLDPTTANKRPNYGGANAIKTKMLECASKITIGIAITTEQTADKTLFTRAAGSFFRDLGFKTNETGAPASASLENYVLRANARFESVSQNVVSCRYYLDASLYNKKNVSLFSFTENDRKAHPDNASEARRLAVHAVETSFKEEKFANEFNSWLNSLVE